MILKICAVILLLLTVGCVFVAHTGDNSDARALAGIFYLPAIAFGVIDGALWLIVFLR